MGEEAYGDVLGAARPRIHVDPATTQVCVLSGGWSDEREISIRSGKACAGALRKAGFPVTEMDPSSQGFFGDFASRHVDVAFVAMHGRYGEDGCIQGYLELLGVPYTFSGVAAHAMAMEKQHTKQLYLQAGIPTPQGMAFAPEELRAERDAGPIVERLGLPLIVKPSANGSSIGVTRVKRAEELPGAMVLASGKGQSVLVEQCLGGMEITVPVVGNARPMALPVVEVVMDGEFYDTQVKYEPSELHHVIPARLPEAVYARAQRYAVEAHRALGCLGCSRSDFIVTGDGEPHILETNTIPGMTETSLLPDSARHIGIEFPELCTLFVEYALEAHPRRGGSM